MDRYNIFLSKSTDDGETWQPAVQVNTNRAKWGVSVRFAPNIAITPDNDLYVVWQQEYYYDDANETTDFGDIYFAKSIDGGTSWSEQKRIDDDTGFDSQQQPDIAVDQWGNIHVVWQDTRNGQEAVYYAKSINGGQSWTPDKKIGDGVFTSGVYTATMPAIWQSFTISHTLPPSTNVTLSGRFGLGGNGQPVQWGDWTEFPSPNANLSTYPLGSHFQWRAELGTSDETMSPQIHNATLIWHAADATYLPLIATE